jgi:hypothetical protein
VQSAWPLQLAVIKHDHLMLGGKTFDSKDKWPDAKNFCGMKMVLRNETSLQPSCYWKSGFLFYLARLVTVVQEAVSSWVRASPVPLVCVKTSPNHFFKRQISKQPSGTLKILVKTYLMFTNSKSCWTRDWTIVWTTVREETCDMHMLMLSVGFRFWERKKNWHIGVWCSIC